MELKNVRMYHRARYPFLWANTTEEERMIRAHRAQLKDDINTFTWDIAQGFQQLAKNGAEGWTWKELESNDPRKQLPEPTTNPGEALMKVITMPPNSIFYLKDFHQFFKDITVTRRALNIKEILKASARMIVFLSAEGANSIPIELRNDISPFTPLLPNREELKETVKRIGSDNGIDTITPAELDAIANSLVGLTEEGAEGALSLSLVQCKKFDPLILGRERARVIETSAGLTYNEYKEKLEDLAGNERVINYILRAAPKPSSSCILLHGAPGTGKSHIAKAIGNALGWSVLQASLSNLRSKYQGNTETALEQMLNTVQALGRTIVFVDEFDKAIAGAEGGADSDAGTGARIVGRLLQYFADRPPDGAYWIFTCNGLKDILTMSGGAMVRRFDAMFFLDMPSASERAQIVQIWAKKMNVTIPADFDTTGMTGADIAKLARTMVLLDCDATEARKYIIPTQQALGSKLDDIRKEAQSTCIPASAPDSAAEAPATRARKVEWKLKD